MTSLMRRTSVSQSIVREHVGNGYAQFDLPVPPYLSRNTVRFGDESWIEVTAVPVDTPSGRSRIPSIG